ncbi:MAG: MFS transporter [Muribaculum sp.]|uniref:MFS transporter n=1 Tax=Candidatus Merdivivens faecigallinarum TaxID=2840871 RepID=A0A9D9IZP7_9BACT|nr:MFS transporter [Candidatus Merdivivens faecigallinarum]
MEKGVFSRDAVLVLAACFCFMSCHTMIIPVLAGFTGSLGGGSLLMGTIVGITNLVSIGFRIVSGPVADRVAKKNLSLWGALMMCAGCTACALTQGTGLLLAARIVHGIGFACCSALPDTISAWQEPPSSWPEDSASSAPNPRPRQWQ